MSYSRLNSEGNAIAPVSQASVGDRLSYLRKVYALLTLGVSAFFATAGLLVWGLFNSVPGLSEIAVLSMKLPWWGHMAALFGASIIAHMTSMVRGLNLVSFFGFAILFGWLTTGLMAMAFQTSGLSILMEALGLTVIVFGGLSAYVLITKKDFSFMGGFLAVGLFLFIGAAIVMGLMSMFGSGMPPWVHMAMAIGSTLLFSLYVLYDTSQILHRFSTDMVVPGALALLIDFIIMFRNILFLLMARD